jgi:hypothetical protein
MNPEDLKAQAARLLEDDDMFKLRLNFLTRGSATASQPDSPALQTIDKAAIDLVATMVEHIRDRRLTPAMAELLADHLSGFRAEQSLALFGLNKANRPTTKWGQQTSAVTAFTDTLRRGLNEESALIEAYDAYFSAGPLSINRGKRRTHADDSSAGKSAARSTMKSTIRPLLVQMGLLPKSGPGRKRTRN